MREEGFKSDFVDRAKGAETLEIPAADPGQSCPQRFPQVSNAESGTANLLGEAMTVAQVAEMLGCSVWTVRQRYLPQGLPHIRTSASGRLVFFRNQVIRWIVRRQQKGART
ncbi:MAG: hypothetical protein ACRDQZ_19635 [Mycobacteriales bacterium]